MTSLPPNGRPVDGVRWAARFLRGLEQRCPATAQGRNAAYYYSMASTLLAAEIEDYEASPASPPPDTVGPNPEVVLEGKAE